MDELTLFLLDCNSDVNHTLTVQLTFDPCPGNFNIIIQVMALSNKGFVCQEGELSIKTLCALKLRTLCK